MLPATSYRRPSSSDEICKVSQLYASRASPGLKLTDKTAGSSNKTWFQNGGQNTSTTRFHLKSVIPHLLWLTANIYRLGRKRSRQSHGLSKTSIKLPGRLDANYPPTSSIMLSNLPFATMPLYTPHPHNQLQSIVLQPSRPMDLRKIPFETDQPRHKLVLMKKVALKAARKGKGLQRH